ncbi:HK97 family phage prohead protease [Paracraurococcus ruber]|uniref:Prohead serine protease domain-containing protein n=1 Tax=Paracraurococcus ruber TaxID=77675 RepID=A0ABS1D245_9PROT|nr:HK97 family phage prohead protease [Paracraurococcus ruber]MBK1660748.1 hypothetical protein [Paracraurococcus ruber]TDG27155.1 HK97 family phage prohead protease [Paracraurococcus ruber]
MHPLVTLPDGTTQRLECRTVAQLHTQGRRLEGYAAIFNHPGQIGRFTEVVRPGAFTRSLASHRDVLALVDHDLTRLLARSGSGTLRLSEDTRGLAFALDLPDTQLGRDMLALAERRDLGGMSFGFVAKDEAWPTQETRELRSVDLIEISVVQAFPAYDATTVAARSQKPAGPSALARARQRWMETV